MRALSHPVSTMAMMTGSTGTTTLVLVVLLAVIVGAMVATAAWLVRSTRTDAPALAPLEVMSARRWVRADPDRRTGELTTARPDGAPPPAPMVPFDAEPETEAGAESEPDSDEVAVDPPPEGGTGDAVPATEVEHADAGAGGTDGERPADDPEHDTGEVDESASGEPDENSVDDESDERPPDLAADRALGADDREVEAESS